MDGGGVKGQAGPEKAEVRGLAHRRDHQINLERELGAGPRYRAQAAAGVGLSQFRLLGYELLDPALPQEAHRQAEEMELHPFPAGLLHLRGQSRHEGRSAAIEEVNLLGPGPPGRAGRVHRGVAAPDDGHPAACGGGFPSLTALKKLMPSWTPVKFSPGICRLRPLWAPRARKTAAKSRRRSSRWTSRPNRVRSRTSAPSFTTTLTSRSSTSRGRRKGGM